MLEFLLSLLVLADINKTFQQFFLALDGDAPYCLQYGQLTAIMAQHLALLIIDGLVLV